MSKIVTYPNGNKKVRMEAVNGELYFAMCDIAYCMDYDATVLYHYVIRNEEVVRIKNIKRKGEILALSESAIRRIVKNGKKDFSTFVFWFDQICEENKPEKKQELIPTNIPMEFDKERLRNFLEGAAEFFSALSKLVAYNTPS